MLGPHYVSHTFLKGPQQVSVTLTFVYLSVLRFLLEIFKSPRQLLHSEHRLAVVWRAIHKIRVQAI